MKIATTIRYYSAQECAPMIVPFTDFKSLKQNCFSHDFTINFCFFCFLETLTNLKIKNNMHIYQELKVHFFP